MRLTGFQARYTLWLLRSTMGPRVATASDPQELHRRCLDVWQNRRDLPTAEYQELEAEFYGFDAESALATWVNWDELLQDLRRFLPNVLVGGK